MDFPWKKQTSDKGVPPFRESIIHNPIYLPLETDGLRRMWKLMSGTSMMVPQNSIRAVPDLWPKAMHIPVVYWPRFWLHHFSFIYEYVLQYVLSLITFIVLDWNISNACLFSSHSSKLFIFLHIFPVVYHHLVTWPSIESIHHFQTHLNMLLLVISLHYITSHTISSWLMISPFPIIFPLNPIKSISIHIPWSHTKFSDDLNIHTFEA
jgi:hypothetical protein